MPLRFDAYANIASSFFGAITVPANNAGENDVLSIHNRERRDHLSCLGAINVKKKRKKEKKGKKEQQHQAKQRGITVSRLKKK